MRELHASPRSARELVRQISRPNELIILGGRKSLVPVEITSCGENIDKVRPLRPGDAGCGGRRSCRGGGGVAIIVVKGGSSGAGVKMARSFRSGVGRESEEMVAGGGV